MMNSSDYIEVEVSIDPFSEENAEILEAMLSDLPYDSFEIGEGSVKCYIQQPLFDRRALRVVLDGLPFAAEFKANKVPFQNWNAQWESSFKPIVVDGVVTVRQVDDKTVPRTQYNIVLRPEMAFGTGHHETTYMMMQSMLEHKASIRDAVVMDM
ncbi:MAG TPA: 50S ribosomal protein L11 methyltransferase, partial [Rikenellaceae bacterium]|nr:50S ribosomal protein L11 methyltransferase [Rikenellaceae bacterium]